MAMFQRMISQDALKKVPQLYSLYEKSVVTNISLKNILTWLGVAQRIADDPETVQTMTIDRTYVTPYRTPGGAQVLLPDRDGILTAFQEFFQLWDSQ